MLVLVQMLACLNLLFGDEEGLSPPDDKHCHSGLAEASKKIKQHCNSFELFFFSFKNNPVLVIFSL